MKEEVLFRGIPIGGARNQWVYGSFHKYLPYTPGIDQEPKEEEYQYLIIQDGFSDWNMPRQLRVAQVYPESVGMCSGFKDYRGIPIYEGDIVKCRLRLIGSEVMSRKIEYHDGIFWAYDECGEKGITVFDLLKEYLIGITGHYMFDQYWDEVNDCYTVTE